LIVPVYTLLTDRYKPISMARKNGMRKTTKTLIYAVQLEIKSYPLKNKKISAIVKDTGLDRKMLEAGFKLLFGITIKKYQLKQKMEHSQQLLDAGRHTIKEIAFKCGYSSQNSYAKAFKKLVGQTPTDWQNRLEPIE
jgi:AraC-like DNA-binding protein